MNDCAHVCVSTAQKDIQLYTSADGTLFALVRASSCFVLLDFIGYNPFMPTPSAISLRRHSLWHI